MPVPAYLIVVCDPETNAILSAHVWSSPEWQQSRQLPARTYVAYSLRATSFADGIQSIHEMVRDPGSHYHYLLPYLNLDGFE